MKARVVILGGGISGLTSAWSLARSSSRHEVVLLESSHRLGGWINSERTANNGAVHELGPRSMRVAGNAGKTALAMVIITSTNYYYYYIRSKIRVIPLTIIIYIKLRSPWLSLFLQMSDLGLDSQIIPIKRGHKAAQRRFIYTNKYKLVELPSSILWLLTTKPPFTKPLLSALARELFVKPGPKEEDESVHDFFNRRFGAEVWSRFLQPVSLQNIQHRLQIG